MSSHLPGAVDVESSVVPASEISSVGDATYSGQMASDAANRNGVQGDGDFRKGGGKRNSLVTFHEVFKEEESDMVLLEATTSASNLVGVPHDSTLASTNKLPGVVGKIPREACGHEMWPYATKASISYLFLCG